MKRYLIPSLIILFAAGAAFEFSSCGTDVVTQIFVNEVAAKDRLDMANSQAKAKYGNSTKLALIMGRNVKSNGKTDISALSAITSLDSIGAWLYVYRVPADTSLRVFTPNPVPGATDCIELTSFFDINTLLTLIPDTSARNIISGALNLVATTNIGISTPTASLINSDEALNLANNTNPVIKFDSSFIPSSSSMNGNAFFSTGTNKTINVFLIPAAGTLHLPEFIRYLTGFPDDLWIVNYKKLDNGGTSQNLILGTVVQSGQIMGFSSFSLQSKVINLSKFAQ